MQGTDEAELHPGLAYDPDTMFVIQKGNESQIDSCACCIGLRPLARPSKHLLLLPCRRPHRACLCFQVCFTRHMVLTQTTRPHCGPDGSSCDVVCPLRVRR